MCSEEIPAVLVGSVSEPLICMREKNFINLRVYKKALTLMAIDYIDTMVSEASSEWLEDDNRTLKPRVVEGPIFDEFIQQYIEEAKELVCKP
jgi:hypothetical protein